MEKRLESVIRKIIFKKYPSLYDVNIEDDMKHIESFVGTSYICRLKSDKCLESKEQMEIDTEVKMLFLILSPPTKSFRKPSIRCFFDCGGGYEFIITNGYNH